jgi:putative flavoprotein involved in K+ transport
MEPRIRVKTKDLTAAGVEFVPRTAGVRDGQPLLDDGRVLDVSAVIWATGYRPALDWIDLPVIAENGDIETDHHGAVSAHPGLYRLGRAFLYAFNSHTVGGVGRDAERIARRIASSRTA